MKFLAALAGVVLGTFLLTQSAQATKCERLKPAQHIGNTDIIFYGELVRSQHLPKKNEQVDAGFKVIRAYKGVQEDTVRIRYYNDNGGVLGWSFEIRSPTLIFAASVPEAEGKRNV